MINFDLKERSGPFNDRTHMIGSSLDHLYWREKLVEAKAFMLQRSSVPATLIEVAAQHPLVEGMLPNEEFSNRLLLGKELLERELAAGRHAEIYVPGSVHVHQGVTDKISLSEAGRTFLLKLGVPSNIIHGEDLNQRYKCSDGVYGSADECFVAANYFRDGQFGRLISVLSPVQMYRKTLHYIEFGVLPLNYTAPAFDTFHNWIDEIVDQIPRVLLADPDLQHPNSKWARELRQSRTPRGEEKA